MATVSRWTAADPAFAEGLAAARAAGRFARSSGRKWLPCPKTTAERPMISACTE